MRHNELLPLDLQFFAEESVNTSDVADSTGEGATTDVTDTTTDTTDSDGGTDGGANDAGTATQQTDEENRRYAAIRRQAEHDAQMKYQSEQARLDAMFAERFKGLTNPETNQPIKGAQDYFEALAAQERLEAREEMQQAGVDPSIIDRAIANSPLMQQAQTAIQQSHQLQSQRMIEEDMREIISFDPSLSSEQDLVTSETFGDVVAYCQSHPGMRLPDAYKIVNFDRLAHVRAESAQQQAINNAKSKGHLTTASGLSVDDKTKEIPEAERESWKEWFPDMSEKDLKALYNKVN